MTSGGLGRCQVSWCHMRPVVPPPVCTSSTIRYAPVWQQQQQVLKVIWEERVALTQLSSSYSGTPQIHPKTAPSPSTITTHLIHPSFDQPHSPSQTASGSTQPFCHSTLSDRHTDAHTQTDRWARRQVSETSVRTLAVLIQSFGWEIFKAIFNCKFK